MQLAPGDALTTMQLSPDVSVELMETLRARFWLDRPAHMQYIKWITQLFRGDLGYSFLWHASVSWVIKATSIQQLNSDRHLDGYRMASRCSYRDSLCCQPILLE